MRTFSMLVVLATVLGLADSNAEACSWLDLLNDDSTSAPNATGSESLVGPNSGDQMGQAVAVSGDGKVFAVGAHTFNREKTSESDFEKDAGLVRTYRVEEKSVDGQNDTSSVVTKIGQDLIGRRSEIYLGRALSLNYDGTRLAAGAPGFHGGVEIYDWNEVTGIWDTNQMLDSDNPYGWFGFAVGLSDDGNVLAATEARFGRENSRDEERPGAVKVFEYDASQGSWAQRGQTLTGTGMGIEFGRFLDLSRDGESLFVGSSEEGFYLSGTDDNAYAQLYQFDEIAKTWNTVGEPLAYEFLMTGLAIADNHTIAIATSNEAIKRGKSKVRILRNHDGKFKRVGNVLELTEHKYSRFAIDLSNDGRTLVVGHNQGREDDDDSNDTPPGDVEIYRLQSNKWKLKNYFVGENDNDRFGVSVAMSNDGGLVVAGALGHGSDPHKAGYAKVYGGNPGACPSSALSPHSLLSSFLALSFACVVLVAC